MQCLWMTKRGLVASTVLLTAVLNLSAVANDIEVDTRPSPEIVPGFVLKENLCLHAQIRTANMNRDLGGLIDGSATSGVAIDTRDNGSFEIEFNNRAPWLNQVRIIAHPDLIVNLKIRNADRNLESVDWMRTRRAIDDHVEEHIFRAGDLRATALVVSVSVEPSAISRQIYEIESFFNADDPDQVLGNDDGTYEVGVEYCQYYKKAICKNPNIPDTKKDATNLANRLNNHLGWTKKFAWGNDMAWETDFNINDDIWVDDVDFAYFSGHGSIGTAWFTVKHNDCSLYRTEATGRYGTRDMEWIGFSSCQTIRRQTNNLVDWFGAFKALHLICGWHSSMRDLDFGGPFGKRVGSWKWTITQSWFDAAYATHGSFLGSIFGKSIYSPTIIAEDKAQFSDHVWGAGPVTADPVHDNIFWVAWTEFRSFKSAQPPSIDLNESNSVFIEAKDGPNFVVPNTVVNRTQPDSVLNHMVVNNRLVDVVYVDNIRDGFCLNDSIFCGAPILLDTALNEYKVIDGVHELHVSIASGGWTYANTSSFAVPTDTAPALLPTESQALSSTSSYWPQHGVVVSDVADSFVTYARQEKWTTSGITSDAWDLNINAERLRYAAANGKRIVGPGASMAVTLGELSEVQRAAFGGWRDVVAGPSFTAITLNAALQSVASSGPEITIGSLPLCDTFVVIDANLGYYENNPDTIISELTPVWIVDGVCVFQGDTSAYQMLVPAEQVSPVGSILTPPNGTVVNTNTPVSFTGSASSGQPPYQYSWTSDRDGLLGSGASLNVDSLTTDPRSGSTTHTISLEVTDANGLKDLDAISVTVNTLTVGGSIRTTQARLWVNQIGRIGSQIPLSAFHYFSDTTDYMFDGSFVLGNSELGLSWSLYDAQGCPPLEATTPMSFDSTSFGSYRIASGSGRNADSTLGFSVDYYAPKHPDSSNFFIARFKVFKGTKNPTGTMSGISMAFATDWNIPSDTAAQNTCGKDSVRQMIYQRGTATAPNLNRFGAIAAYRSGASPLAGGFVWENEAHVPLTQSDLWNTMQSLGASQYSVVSSSADLSSVLVIGKNLTINGATNDTIKFAVVIAATGASGSLSTIQSNIDKGKAWICAHNLLPGTSICNVCKCGDADNNGAWTISDVVRLINYIFAGGPAPALPCLGDANGSHTVSISDAVFLINFIFGGGPAPSGCN